MPEDPPPSYYLLALYYLFLCVFVFWVFAFVGYGAVVTVVNMARTADIHEVVPPIIATVLVWELAVMDMISTDYAAAPLTVRLAVIFGGPLSVTAVSLWELRRLKTRHNRSIRQALGR